MKCSIHQTVIVIAMMGLSCSERTEKPGWMDDLPHVQSPDKQAFIYQSSTIEGDSLYISVATWVNSTDANGGAGIFDIKFPATNSLSIYWESDSVVAIVYPRSGRIIRQESQSYFDGRSTYFEYRVAE